LNRALALDTSTWLGGLALVEAGADGEIRTVAELNVEVRDSHADHLLRRIELLLSEAGWSKSSIDLYAATRGPGSFTGLRVGLGTIRGLSLATGRPAVGVTTVRALAEAHGPDRRERLTVLDAGRRELYGARFDAASSPPEPRERPWLDSRDAVAERVRNRPWVVVPGPGTRFVAGGRSHAVRTPRAIAAATGRLALFRRPETPGSSELAPLYVRPPDAVLKRRRR
jgi:tRNA threonylcarbamoyladenosine biosynthesis protein TsaB